MTVITYADQAVNYFGRASNGVPGQPVDAPAAWLGAEMAAHPERWRFPLSPAAIAELGDRADLLMTAGVPLGEVTRENFALPGWRDDLARWRKTLRSGTGVVCLRGLPVRQWGTEKTTFAYWGLGHHLGSPGVQNPAGELLGHVTNYNEQDVSPLVRLYRTAEDIAFHCDAADVVGLLCLRTAREGGQSRIASSVTVFNALLSQRPDLAQELFEVFDVDRRDEEGPGEPPTFQLPPCAWDGNELRTFWHSDYMRSAERHDTVQLSERRREVIELYDELANSEQLRLDMWLDEGDVQFISNHTVVHARTGYVDHESPDERRHLLRLWLSLDG